MNHRYYTAGLAEHAIGGLTYLWPVTAGLALLLSGALFCDLKRKRLNFDSRLLLLLLPGIGVLFILPAGSLFARQPGLRSERRRDNIDE